MTLTNLLRAILALLLPTAVVALALIGLSLAGCGSENGSSGSSGQASTLGEPPAEEVPAVAAGSLSEETLGETVQIEGEVVKQCPAAGCWLIVKDETGEVFVDLNPAGLRLTEKREGEQARVAGRVAKQGGQFRLEAQSVQFGAGAKPDDK